MEANHRLARAFDRPRGFCPPVPERPPGCCFHPSTPPDRPDLAVYSQEEQLAANAVPSWNSPDITTNRDIPWALLPEHQVKVRNLSPTASAVNGLVSVWTSPFGIGTLRTPLSSQVVALGPGQETTLLFPLNQSLVAAGEHSLGVHVAIQHPYDSVQINNRGSQVVSGVMTSAVGRQPSLSFPVVNSSAAQRTINLAVMPNPLGAAALPASRGYAAWEQATATLMLQVPAGMHGSTTTPLRHEITVVARDAAGSLVDGLTYIVWVDD
jgi:hypothetical protein